MATTAPLAPSAQAKALLAFLDGHDKDVRDAVRGWLDTPSKEPKPHLHMDEHCTQLLE